MGKTEKLFDDAERKLLGIVAEGLSDGGSASVYTNIAITANKALKGLTNALVSDLAEELSLNAEQQCNAAGASASILESFRASAGKAAASEGYKQSPLFQQFVSNMKRSANETYANAVASVGVRSLVVGKEQAVKETVRGLAEKGLYVNTYTRKDGTRVDVPVDVGVRNAVTNAGRQRRMAQTYEIASRTGMDLVEVNTTANCRESHASWQGGIYSLSGTHPDYPAFASSCHVGDPVIGIGGYNCGHEFRIYHPSRGKTFPEAIKDPNYTTEEVRSLTARQRSLENNIRKLKRASDVMESAGIDHKDVTHLITKNRSELRGLIAEHPTVLKRQSWREQIVRNEKQYSVYGNAKMAVGMSIKWPERHEMLDTKQRLELVEYGLKRGLKIEGLKKFGVDPKVVRAFADAVERVVTEFPELAGTGRKPIRLTFEELGNNDFAMINNTEKNLIVVNEAAARSYDDLARIIKEESANRYFAADTVESIIYHEMGHMFADKKNFDCVRVSIDATGIPNAIVRKYGKRSERNFAVVSFADDNISLSNFFEESVSLYAGESLQAGDFREVVAECFSAYMSGVRNHVVTFVVERMAE